MPINIINNKDAYTLTSSNRDGYTFLAKKSKIANHNIGSNIKVDVYASDITMGIEYDKYDSLNKQTSVPLITLNGLNNEFYLNDQEIDNYLKSKLVNLGLHINTFYQVMDDAKFYPTILFDKNGDLIAIPSPGFSKDETLKFLKRLNTNQSKLDALSWYDNTTNPDTLPYNINVILELQNELFKNNLRATATNMLNLFITKFDQFLTNYTKDQLIDVMITLSFMSKEEFKIVRNLKESVPYCAIANDLGDSLIKEILQPKYAKELITPYNFPFMLEDIHPLHSSVNNTTLELTSWTDKKAAQHRPWWTVKLLFHRNLQQAPFVLSFNPEDINTIDYLSNFNILPEYDLTQYKDKILKSYNDNVKPNIDGYNNINHVYSVLVSGLQQHIDDIMAYISKVVDFDISYGDLKIPFDNVVHFENVIVNQQIQNIVSYKQWTDLINISVPNVPIFNKENFETLKLLLVDFGINEDQFKELIDKRNVITLQQILILFNKKAVADINNIDSNYTLPISKVQKDISRFVLKYLQNGKFTIADKYNIGISNIFNYNDVNNWYNLIKLQNFAVLNEIINSSTLNQDLTEYGLNIDQDSFSMVNLRSLLSIVLIKYFNDNNYNVNMGNLFKNLTTMTFLLSFSEILTIPFKFLDDMTLINQFGKDLAENFFSKLKDFSSTISNVFHNIKLPNIKNWNFINYIKNNGLDYLVESIKAWIAEPTHGLRTMITCVISILKQCVSWLTDIDINYNTIIQNILLSVPSMLGKFVTKAGLAIGASMLYLVDKVVNVLDNISSILDINQWVESTKDSKLIKSSLPNDFATNINLTIYNKYYSIQQSPSVDMILQSNHVLNTDYNISKGIMYIPSKDVKTDVGSYYAYDVDNDVAYQTLFTKPKIDLVSGDLMGNDESTHVLLTLSLLILDNPFYQRKFMDLYYKNNAFSWQEKVKEGFKNFGKVLWRFMTTSPISLAYHSIKQVITGNVEEILSTPLSKDIVKLFGLDVFSLLADNTDTISQFRYNIPSRTHFDDERILNNWVNFIDSESTIINYIYNRSSFSSIETVTDVSLLSDNLIMFKNVPFVNLTLNQKISVCATMYVDAILQPSRISISNINSMFFYPALIDSQYGDKLVHDVCWLISGSKYIISGLSGYRYYDVIDKSYQALKGILAAIVIGVSIYRPSFILKLGSALLTMSWAFSTKVLNFAIARKRRQRLLNRIDSLADRDVVSNESNDLTKQDVTNAMNEVLANYDPFKPYPIYKGINKKLI